MTMDVCPVEGKNGTYRVPKAMTEEDARDVLNAIRQKRGPLSKKWIVMGDFQYCGFSKQALKHGCAALRKADAVYFDVPRRLQDPHFRKIADNFSHSTVPLVLAPGGQYVGGAEEFQKVNAVESTNRVEDSGFENNVKTRMLSDAEKNVLQKQQEALRKAGLSDFAEHLAAMMTSAGDEENSEYEDDDMSGDDEVEEVAHSAVDVTDSEQEQSQESPALRVENDENVDRNADAEITAQSTPSESDAQQSAADERSVQETQSPVSDNLNDTSKDEDTNDDTITVVEESPEEVMLMRASASPIAFEDDDAEEAWEEALQQIEQADDVNSSNESKNQEEISKADDDASTRNASIETLPSSSSESRPDDGEPYVAISDVEYEFRSPPFEEAHLLRLREIFRSLQASSTLTTIVNNDGSQNITLNVYVPEAVNVSDVVRHALMTTANEQEELTMLREIRDMVLAGTN